jgi:hypothetical protein
MDKPDRPPTPNCLLKKKPKKSASHWETMVSDENRAERKREIAYHSVQGANLADGGPRSFRMTDDQVPMTNGSKRHWSFQRGHGDPKTKAEPTPLVMPHDFGRTHRPFPSEAIHDPGTRFAAAAGDICRS